MTLPDAETAAARDLAEAWLTGVPVPGRSLRLPGLDRTGGYRVQSAVVSLLEAQLGRRVGWKLGLMSRQAATDPFCGPLHSAMAVPDGGVLSLERAIDPRIEVEIAFVLSADVMGPIEGDHAARIPVEVGAAFEIIDDRVVPPAEVPFAIADMATMRQAVIGPARPIHALADVEAELVVNGEVVATGRLTEQIRDPFEGLAWLSRHLADHDDRLRAGDIVLTGSLTGQIPLHAGASYEGRVTGLAPVTART